MVATFEDFEDGTCVTTEDVGEEAIEDLWQEKVEVGTLGFKGFMDLLGLLLAFERLRECEKDASDMHKE